jgi:peptidoglycan/LPS O-acetylase OafA/YrhL
MSGDGGRMPHLPALDGLRGLAVIGVLLFHGEFPWARGGYLGVSVFFTLSGFLITNLLVREHGASGRIALGTFWSRRFRRLMPAALATLLAVCLYGWLFASNAQLRDLRGDLFAALGYVANWRFVFAEQSYADLFAAPSPVQHFWSLAVEEQFYVVYPLVVAGLLRLGGKRLLAVVLGAAAIASLAWSLHLRLDADRVYYGTDTRIAELLAGAVIALWWIGRPALADPPRTRARSFAVAALGVFALAGTLALWTRVDQTSQWLVRGVLPLQALLSVGLVLTAARPGVVAWVLSWRPLRAIGLVSYGLYLYHWPIFLVLSPERTDLSRVPLFALRVAATTALSVASYFVLEQPIRRRRVLVRPFRVPAAAAFGVVAIIAATVAVTTNVPPSNIAFAGVDIEDNTVTVHETAPADIAGGVALPGAPRSVMIIGDSATYDAAPALGALYASMGAAKIVDASYPGFGLTRNPDGWKHDWPLLVADAQPDLIIVNLGEWDEPYIEEHGQDAFVDVLDEAYQVVTAAGAKVLWIAPYQGGVSSPDVMNAAYQAIAARHPDTIAFVDASSVLRAPDGTYPRWLLGDDGTLVLARKPDGWHFCPEGAARIARFALQRTGALGWSPTVAPEGWEDGDWRTAARYDDPDGGCDTSRPENQPPVTDP